MDLETELRRVYVQTMANEFRTSRRNGDLKDTSLNYYSMMYLDIIYSMKDCTVNSLSELLGVNKSTVSKKIDWLAEHGYVDKVRDERDGRIFHIVLNEEVVRNMKVYDEPGIKAARRIRSELTPEELEGFLKALSIYSEEFGRDAP